MSDGTDELRFLDPATFAERRRLRVTAEGQPVKNLNELEYVKGEIFANIWTNETDMSRASIPKTGASTGWIDLRGLLSPRRTGTGGRPERHRVRRGQRPAVRHRQALAARVRDPAHADEVERTPTRLALARPTCPGAAARCGSPRPRSAGSASSGDPSRRARARAPRSAACSPGSQTCRSRNT